MNNKEQNLNEPQKPQLHISDVISSPNQLEPVLALITHQGELGLSEWYEVVYHFDKWYSYAGSKTFQDGEQVVDWKYAKDCL
jgi:hypothetical protein